MTKIDSNSSNQRLYDEFLGETLKKSLFETAGNLRLLLNEKFGVLDSNARKIIARSVANKAIKSSKPYTFGKGQYLYLCNEQYLDLQAVKIATKKLRPPIHRLLDILEQNGGIISFYDALKVTGLPIESSSTKVNSLEDILKVLQKLEIVSQEKATNGVIYIYDNRKKVDFEVFPDWVSIYHSSMVLDCAILPDILRWLQTINLIDNSSILYRSKKTPHIGIKHNNLVWDSIAYTKTTGINPILATKAISIEKQTLVTLDVVLSREYSQSHFDGFMSRIQSHRSSVKSAKRKILPIIIYKTCSVETLNRIRKNGILTFDIATIFGSKIYSVLEKLGDLSTFSSHNSTIEETVESILTSIKDAGQEDALKELKGTLFEYLMYPLLKARYPDATIERGKVLRKQLPDGTSEFYEYDYIIESNHPSEIVVVELKGYHSGATIPLGNSDTKSSLRWFFRKSLPFAQKHFREKIENGKQMKAVFITSANFWKDGQDFIKKMNESTYLSTNLNTGYERKDLLKLLKDLSFRKEMQVIEKFYKAPHTSSEEMEKP